MSSTKTLAFVVALALTACAKPSTAEIQQTRSWPSSLLSGPGTGPALFLGPAADSPAIGFLSESVPVQIAGAPVGDRLPVRVEGNLRARGWLSMSRVVGRVQTRGRVQGTPTYVGPGDIVGVIGEVAPGTMRVEVRPWLGSSYLGPYVGTIPTRVLGASSPPASQGGALPGSPHSLPVGAEVSVHESPGGAVVATLPASSPPLVVTVLRERDGWHAIRVGQGPYLIGYIQSELTPTASPHMVAPPEPLPSRLPRRILREEPLPLHRLAPNTRVRFDGRTIAILSTGAYAREIRRFPEHGEVDVYVAADDRIAVRGLVRISELLPTN